MSSERSEYREEIAAMGVALRLARRRQGLSVQALSAKSDVSFGLISQLERGMGNPSFVSLQRLAEALEVPLPKLVSGVANQDALVVRRSERRLLPFSRDEPESRQVVRELVTPANQSVLQVIRSTVPPGFSNEGRAFRHIGMECVVVESGSLVVVHGDRRVELGVGDSMTYECSVPHWWANTTDAPAVVLGAVTPFEI
ncbi:cupin domain-containing protein [Galbitalea sp. SE-J8]|uniref:helix-turn-helix domain-containing protein n=1 Tax=Galbitalea sp. SE-J8 TaxID=3054952 RepID=UPI00259CDE29|nr:cupin domain-containing protein [Galbitalea sp. SE-J8]MDM4761495.1 cupin domain-containing protein [Galbitalea sp. SE-J8]